MHYLALLEQKTNALDQAAPLAGWQLPEEFGQLRRQMEARLGKRGRREYVQVLRLLETFSLQEVAAAVRQAQQLQAIAFDAVKHLLLWRPRATATEVGSGTLPPPAGSCERTSGADTATDSAHTTPPTRPMLVFRLKLLNLLM